MYTFTFKCIISQQKAKKEEEKRLKEKEEENKGAKEKTYNWKKSHKGRYFYKDAADVIQEGKPTMHTISRLDICINYSSVFFTIEYQNKKIN